MESNGANGDPALRVREVSFSYGPKKALSNVSFELPAGTFTALLGPNGAGKTTLLALITRLFGIPEGRIEIAGVDLAAGGSAALAPLGVVFQEQTLDLDLTAEQNLLYFAGLRGLPRQRARERGETVLELTGIADLRKEKVRRLSGGQRRRLEIARALIHEPALLVLDEPTVGLDIPTRKALVEDLHAMVADAELTVLWTTHLVDEVLEGDRIVVLDQGEVRAAGSLHDVLASLGLSGVGEAFHALTARAEAVP